MSDQIARMIAGRERSVRTDAETLREPAQALEDHAAARSFPRSDVFHLCELAGLPMLVFGLVGKTHVTLQGLRWRLIRRADCSFGGAIRSRRRGCGSRHCVVAAVGSRCGLAQVRSKCGWASWFRLNLRTPLRMHGVLGHFGSQLAAIWPISQLDESSLTAPSDLICDC